MIRFKAFLLIIFFIFYCGKPALYSQELPLASPLEPFFQALSSGKLELAFESLGKFVDENLQSDATLDSDLSNAVGGLYRELSQRSIDERYKLLYAWTMPTEKRDSIRVMTRLVSQVAPPPEFARVLGKRPRDAAFGVRDGGER